MAHPRRAAKGAHRTTQPPRQRRRANAVAPLLRATTAPPSTACVPLQVAIRERQEAGLGSVSLQWTVKSVIKALERAAPAEDADAFACIDVDVAAGIVPPPEHRENSGQSSSRAEGGSTSRAPLAQSPRALMPPPPPRPLAPQPSPPRVLSEADSDDLWNPCNIFHMAHASRTGRPVPGWFRGGSADLALVSTVTCALDADQRAMLMAAWAADEPTQRFVSEIEAGSDDFPSTAALREAAFPPPPPPLLERWECDPYPNETPHPGCLRPPGQGPYDAAHVMYACLVPSDACWQCAGVYECWYQCEHCALHTQHGHARQSLHRLSGAAIEAFLRNTGEGQSGLGQLGSEAPEVIACDCCVAPIQRRRQLNAVRAERRRCPYIRVADESVPLWSEPLVRLKVAGYATE
jgi:hypothetical protein